MKKLLPLVVGLALLSALPATASALPATKFGASAAATQLAVDGGIAYATNGKSIVRMVVADGTSRRIYSAPRGWRVDFVLADGGVAALQLSKPARDAVTATRVLAFDERVGRPTTVTSAKTSARKDFMCGSDVQATDVTPSGEIISVRFDFAFHSKICRKPFTTTSLVRGHGPSGARTLFNGSLGKSKAFDDLGSILSGAELVGDRLLLTGSGAGILNLTTQQFSLVKKGGRASYYNAALDPNGNMLATKKSTVSERKIFDLSNAAANYAPAGQLELTRGLVRYEVCGNHLLRLQFAAKRGAASSAKVLANPLIATAAPNLDQLVPAGEDLVNGACDENQVLLSTYRNGRSFNLWRAPLTG